MIQPVHHKIPESVLVVIHTQERQVLLMRRADGGGHDFWQSVTGSKNLVGENWKHTAAREVREETGIDVYGPGCVLTDWHIENIYPIYAQWAWRYAPGVTHNREHVLGLRVPSETAVVLNPREHTAYAWLDWREAAKRCFSPTNAEAILCLPRFP